MLEAMGTLYVNGQGSCANYILKSLQPSSNYSISIGGSAPQSAAQFNGQNSYISIPYSPALYPGNSVTISLWFETQMTISGGWTNLYNTAGFSNNCDNGAYCVRICCSTIYFTVTTSTHTTEHASRSNSKLNGQINGGSWNNVVATFNGVAASLYWDGTFESSNAIYGAPIFPDVNSITMGDGSVPFNGLVANLQVYNTALSQQQISLLYLEGIGGAPVATQSIVGWWPLSGDANNYANTPYASYPSNIAFAQTSYNSISLMNSFSVTSASVPLPLLNYSTGKYKLYNVGVYSWR
jgi:hypothetical protein